MDIVLASNNKGKADEIRDLLSNTPLNLLSMADLNIPDVEETGLTFVENAILKARNACEHSGLPAIADDSGLVVHALDGMPGVFSARYAKTDKKRIEKLLTELNNTDGSDRSAAYHCAIVFMRFAKDPSPYICHGIWPGQILQQPRGDKGFGYDPVFYAPEADMSAGEMDPDEKNHISHRARALGKLKNEIGHLVSVT